jgi:hypothetical protein
MTKKKPYASSRPAKLISVSAESIFSKPVSKTQKAVLSRIAKRQAAGHDSGIDYSDPSPDWEQLAPSPRSEGAGGGSPRQGSLRLAHAVWKGLFHQDQRYPAYRYGADPVSYLTSSAPTKMCM